LHNGQSPTQFRVSISKNCWHCFSECKSGGNILDFVARKENGSIREAVPPPACQGNDVRLPLTAWTEADAVRAGWEMQTTPSMLNAKSNEGAAGEG
jgi:hypothetical protein